MRGKNHSNRRIALLAGGAIILACTGGALAPQQAQAQCGVGGTFPVAGGNVTVPEAGTAEGIAWACGPAAEANGDRSNSFGFAAGALSIGEGNTAIGSFAGAFVTGSNNVAIGDGAGNGTNNNDRLFVSNTVAIGGEVRDANGDVIVPAALANGNYSVAVGTGSLAKGTSSIAVGANSAVDGTNSVAVGAGNTVTGDNSGAFGTGNALTGNGSFVMGDPNVVNGNGTFVLGNDNNVNVPNVAGFGDNIQVVGSNNTLASTANASGSSVLGLNNTVNAANALAVGNGNTVTGANGIVVGHNSNVAGADAIAIGSGTSAGFSNSVVVGNGAQATRANQVVLGTSDHTYTTPGITSAASRAAQSGPLEIVTSDGSGNLAGRSLAELGIASTGDIAGINARLEDLGSRSTKAFAGVAMAFAMAGAPTVLPHERIAFSFNWGNFQGQNALAFSGAVKLHENIQLNAGIGYGTNQNLVGGRAGIRVGW